MRVYYSFETDPNLLDEDFYIEAVVCVPGFTEIDCARDYFDNHDGWEASWPLQITMWILDENLGRKFMGCYNIEIEYEPEFYSKRVRGT